MRSLICLMFVIAALSQADAEELRGVVRGTDGAPVAGITVRLPIYVGNESEPRVEATAETNASGGFVVAIPDIWFRLPPRFRPQLVLTATHKTLGMGGVIVTNNPPLPRQSLTIQLAPLKPRSIHILSHDGSPGADVTVRVAGLHFSVIYPSRFSSTASHQSGRISPDSAQPSGRTDQNGKIEFQLPDSTGVGSVSVEVAPAMEVTWLVYQSTQAPEDWSNTLILPETIRVPIHVNAPEDAFNDLQLNVSNHLQPDPADGGFRGNIILRQDVTLNSEGHGTITGVSGTFIQLRNKQLTATDNRLWISEVTAETTIEVNFGSGVRVRGRIVTQHDQPVVNKNFFAYPYALDRPGQTDSEGRFEVVTGAGGLLLIPAGRSDFRGLKLDPESMIKVTSGTSEFDTGDIVWTQLEQVSGVVRFQGLPVGQATVHVLHDVKDSNGNPYRNEQRILADEQGRFTIHRLELGTEVQVAAADDGRFSELTRFVGEELTKPLKITLTDNAAISVGGSIMDGQGKGIGGVEVMIRHRAQSPLGDDDEPNGENILQTPLVTRADGQFETSKSLPPWGEYVAVIHPGTKNQTHTGWRPAVPGKQLSLPRMDVWQTSEVTGLIVDVAGHPLPNVRVCLLTSLGQTEASSDSDGRFTIERPKGRTPLLIAEADGFLANGLLVKRAAPIELILFRLGNSGAQPKNVDSIMIAPEPWTRKQQIELALRLADDLPDDDSRTRMQVSMKLARYVPDHILANLDALPAASTMEGQQIRGQLAMGLSVERPEDGLAILEELPDGPVKLMMALAFVTNTSLADTDRMQLLSRMLQAVRSTDEAPFRVMGMGFIGERLLNMGHRDQAEGLLREALEDAQQLSPVAFAGYARGSFAEELAQIDVDAALELIKPLKDVSEFNRHMQNVAHELAAIDPDRSIAILDMLKDPGDGQRPIVGVRDAGVLRVCYRMIRLAPDDAQSLARTMEHASMRAYCFQLMADSLLSDATAQAGRQDLARQLHDEAWGILATVRQEGDLSEVAWLYPSTIAGLLLPITQQVAADEVAGRTWQTIALRRPMESSGIYQNAGEGCVCELAAALLDTNRHAAALVASWTPPPGTRRFSSYVNFARPAAELIAGLNPNLCDAALEDISESASRNRLRQALINALLRTGESRARAIRSDMALWFPDDEDLGPIE